MSSGAGLLELVARGKKDTFFTGEPKVSFFHSVYTRASPWIRETRIFQAKNNAEWGKFVDIEIPRIGDILKNMTLLIQMPTWLPPEINTIANKAVINYNSIYYGWVNNIAYHLIKRIQLLQDQVVIWEETGESLLFRHRSNETNSERIVREARTGGHNGSGLAIQRNAIARTLELPLSLPFDENLQDGGFPICSLPNSRCLIRIWLTPMMNLISSSNDEICPNPFGKIFNFLENNVRTRQFTSLVVDQLAKPVLSLRANIYYLEKELKNHLSRLEFTTTCTMSQKNELTFEPNLWRQGYSIRIPLEAKSLVRNIRFYFQTEANYLANNYENRKPPPSDVAEWFSQVSLIIHRIERYGPIFPALLDKLNQYLHNINSVGENIYTMDFSIIPKNIAGALNFSHIENPELFFILNNIASDDRNMSKKAFFRVYFETIRVLEIKNGAIRIPFTN